MAEEKQKSNGAGDATQAPAQQFSLQRLYLKDLSFEAPMGAEAFGKNWKPQVNQEINSRNTKLADDTYEVVLSLTITVKLEDKVVFLVEIQQAGIFLLKGFEPPQLGHVMGTLCLQILFPYAREAIDNIVVKGSFPALMLPPVNFDALYQQAVQQAQEKKQQDPPTVN